VLLADDQPMLAKLRKLLEADFEVVGMVSDGRSLVEAAFQWKPDIIVTDISMPRQSMKVGSVSLAKTGIRQPFLLGAAQTT
jgi:AmiR/NasT family two-component response regulator